MIYLGVGIYLPLKGKKLNSIEKVIFRTFMKLYNFQLYFPFKLDLKYIYNF